MIDAVRRRGLSRALKWTGLSALLLLTAGAAVHYAITSAAPAAEPSPAAEATPAAQALPVEHAATRTRTPRPPSDEDSEAPEADEDGDAWLGVVLAGGDDDDEESEGVRILSVAANSPAEEAGLRRNDRIIRMETREIGSYDDIARFMNRQQPGDSVTIVVMRGGSKKTLHATLAEEPRSRRRHVQIFKDDDDEEDDDEDSFRFEMPEIPEPPEPPEPPDAPPAPGRPGAWAFSMGSRPMLGVSVHPMSEELRAYFKAPEDAGILVDRVVEGSAAAKAGIKAGDVIVSVDGKSIADAGDIGEALSEHESGDEVEVRVVRDGSERSFDVTIQKPSGKGRRGSFYFHGPEGIAGLEGLKGLKALKELKGLDGGSWTWNSKHGDALPPEVQEEIERSMRQAHEQVREAMKRVHEELREHKIQLREQRRDGEKQQRIIERQLRDELQRLKERGQGVMHTGQKVSYDL